MTVRENVHQLVDTLPVDRLADVLDYLTNLNDTDEVSDETKAAIGEGLEDIRTGRTITIEVYRRTRGLVDSASSFPAARRVILTAWAAMFRSG